MERLCSVAYCCGTEADVLQETHYLLSVLSRNFRTGSEELVADFKKWQNDEEDAIHWTVTNHYAYSDDYTYEQYLGELVQEWIREDVYDADVTDVNYADDYDEDVEVLDDGEDEEEDGQA